MGVSFKFMYPLLGYFDISLSTEPLTIIDSQEIELRNFIK